MYFSSKHLRKNKMYGTSGREESGERNFSNDTPFGLHFLHQNTIVFITHYVTPISLQWLTLPFASSIHPTTFSVLKTFHITSLLL